MPLNVYCQFFQKSNLHFTFLTQDQDATKVIPEETAVDSVTNKQSNGKDAKNKDTKEEKSNSNGSQSDLN